MRISLSVFALLIAVAGSADAQSALRASSPGDHPLLAAIPATRPAGIELLSGPALASLPAQQGVRSARPGRVVFGLMGGLIGAGTGFFLSQVVHDDWEKETNSTFASHRRSFALSGAAVGVAGAVLLDYLAPQSDGVRLRSAGADRTGSGGAITADEIVEVTGRTAYDAVSALRPQWLITRGETIASVGTLVGAEGGAGPANVTAVAGDARIGAFLDGVPLDGVDALRTIPIASVERIEFRTGSVGASGPGHVQRAILVFSADGASE